MEKEKFRERERIVLYISICILLILLLITLFYASNMENICNEQITATGKHLLNNTCVKRCYGIYDIETLYSNFTLPSFNITEANK